MSQFKDEFLDALETTKGDRENILYMGYLMTKSNRDDFKKNKKIQLKILRAPMSYNSLFQALMFTYHPSYVSNMFKTQAGSEMIPCGADDIIWPIL